LILIHDLLEEPTPPSDWDSSDIRRHKAIVNLDAHPSEVQRHHIVRYLKTWLFHRKAACFFIPHNYVLRKVRVWCSSLVKILRYIPRSSRELILHYK